MTNRVFFSIILLMFLSGSTFTSPSEILKSENWKLYHLKNKATELQYLASKPVKESGNYSRRGPVWLFLTKRKNAEPQVMIDFGYTPHNGLPQEVVFENGKSFKLQVNKSKAYLKRSDFTSFITEAKKGTKLFIKGVSNKNTQTKDEYSLIGFTKCYQQLLLNFN